MSRITTPKGLSPYGRTSYLVCIMWWQGFREFSYKNFSQYTGYTVTPAVKRHLAELAEKQFLSVIKQGGKGRGQETRFKVNTEAFSEAWGSIPVYLEKLL